MLLTREVSDRPVNMELRRNRRNCEEHFIEGRHLTLGEIWKMKTNEYLWKTIPPYPKPVFHVSNLKHDTDRSGLRGICDLGGFCDPTTGPEPKLLWWSLSVGPEEMDEAENRLQMEEGDLSRFATSPAFGDDSRLGPYRFTFPLQELLAAYREQVGTGRDPGRVTGLGSQG